MDNELKKVEKWVGNIRLSHKVEAEMERLRPDILKEVHRRMDAEAKEQEIADGKRKRMVRMRQWTVAAAVVLVAMAAWTVWQLQGDGTGPEPVTLACATGTTSEVTLPDGTQVCLNGGTTLTYDNRSFGKAERRVELQGEAFFDVRRNESVPFIVRCSDVQVRVLGTRFNVENYPEESRTSVTLESGKVSMQTDDASEGCVLAPDQQAVYDRTTRQLSKRTVDATEAMAWMEGKMVFSDLPLEEIARKLERRFNVRIVIQDEPLRQSRYNGTFDTGEGWQRILSLLSTMDSQLQYRVSGGTIHLYRKSSEERASDTNIK